MRSRIDVLTSIDGLDFIEAFASPVTQDIAGRPVPFLGRTSLVQYKRAAGRPKDLADLALLDEVERDVDAARGR